MNQDPGRLNPSSGANILIDFHLEPACLPINKVDNCFLPTLKSWAKVFFRQNRLMKYKLDDNRAALFNNKTPTINIGPFVLENSGEKCH